jgi:hypothetical protein
MPSVQQLTRCWGRHHQQQLVQQLVQEAMASHSLQSLGSCQTLLAWHNVLLWPSNTTDTAVEAMGDGSVLCSMQPNHSLNSV